MHDHDPALDGGARRRAKDGVRRHVGVDRGPDAARRRAGRDAHDSADRTGVAEPGTNRAQPVNCGKPFLTASSAPADYSESPTARTTCERIEGVSRSLPYSDLLALTSSHMFFSVMN